MSYEKELISKVPMHIVIDSAVGGLFSPRFRNSGSHGSVGRLFSNAAE
ncbi:MAG: hypothetical protein GX424_02960 [Clostridiales bacterium]|nr:hypothetical protein [Clostridiales bacterium]